MKDSNEAPPTSKFGSSPCSSNMSHPVWELSASQRLRRLLPSLERYRDRLIVDFGAGDGTVTNALAAAGFRAIAVEGRESNVVLIKERHSIPVIQCNLELEDEFPALPETDVVSLVFGLLYHLSRPAEFLENVARVSSLVAIDTVCLDHDGEAIVFLNEDRCVSANSLSGGGCRPSPGWINSTMASLGFVLQEDLSDTSLNIPPTEGNTGHLYSWDFERTCGWRRAEQQLRKLLLYRSTEQ